MARQSWEIGGGINQKERNLWTRVRQNGAKGIRGVITLNLDSYDEYVWKREWTGHRLKVQTRV